jgi:hypothetical protein
MTTTSSAFLRRAHTMNARGAWALMAAGVPGYEVVSRPILTRAAIAAR